jgi:preprotein translocase subunit SecF
MPGDDKKNKYKKKVDEVRNQRLAERGMIGTKYKDLTPEQKKNLDKDPAVQREMKQQNYNMKKQGQVNKRFGMEAMDKAVGAMAGRYGGLRRKKKK